MKFIPVVIIAAAVFLICFLLDKGFTKLFRGKQEHTSGLSVRLNKRYATAGIIVSLLGVAALFLGGKLMIICGSALILLGIGLIVYYLSFGIFYDTDTFVVSRFGKKSVTYRYSQIKAQQLFNNYGQTIIDLHMEDGGNVLLQSAMVGVYPFLDHASGAWLRQTGKTQEQCSFYDPQNSCWFPPAED